MIQMKLNVKASIFCIYDSVLWLGDGALIYWDWEIRWLSGGEWVDLCVGEWGCGVDSCISMVLTWYFILDNFLCLGKHVCIINILMIEHDAYFNLFFKEFFSHFFIYWFCQLKVQLPLLLIPNLVNKVNISCFEMFCI